MKAPDIETSVDDQLEVLSHPGGASEEVIEELAVQRHPTHRRLLSLRFPSHKETTVWPIFIEGILDKWLCILRKYVLMVHPNVEDMVLSMQRRHREIGQVLWLPLPR